jgi:glutathione S-transferase
VSPYTRAMRLYDNAFSPFARKVRLVLEHKGLEFEVVDGLAIANRETLATVNGRVEVPALEHEGVIVVGSSDIVAYVERVAPARPVYPDDLASWTHARAWERCADSTIDPILIDVSYWMWAERDDVMPDGLLAAAQRDMDRVYAAIERDLEGRSFLAGHSLSIADIALFPHLTATKMMGVPYDAARFPRLHGWLRAMRSMPIFQGDLERVKSFLQGLAGTGGNSHERRKIFWRGDRLEWMLARGQHRWLMKEIEEDRVIWPGLGIPGPGPKV